MNPNNEAAYAQFGLFRHKRI